MNALNARPIRGLVAATRTLAPEEVIALTPRSTSALNRQACETHESSRTLTPARVSCSLAN